ncbi:MAG: DUF3253 domain-containing protein [Rhodovibrionaceae bacterium]
MTQRKDPQDKLDPVAQTILDLLAAEAAGKTIAPADAARAFYKDRRKAGDPADGWRGYMNAANQQALHLARAGRIEILRRGEVQDPHKPIKGLLRLRLPEKT